MNLGVEELQAIAAEWRTARRIQPIYLGIAQRFKLEIPACKELDSPVDRAEPDAIASVRRWLQQMDELIQVHQLRLFLQESPLSTEITLRTLALRHLQKKERTESDRDKLDFLLVQYFAQCAPSSALYPEPSPEDIARVLEPILGVTDAEFPGWLEPLEDALHRMQRCATMRELLRQGILYQVRKIKISAEENYFSTRALVAFTRFNYLMRQAFFRLMRADLAAIKHGVRELQSRGVTEVNCRRAQLSEREPLSRVIDLFQQWKRPFQAEYSAGNPFAQLAELRTSIDEAMVQHGISQPVAEASAISGPTAPPPVQPVVKQWQEFPEPAAESGDILELETTLTAPVAEPAKPAFQPVQSASIGTPQWNPAPAPQQSPGFTVVPTPQPQVATASPQAQYGAAVASRMAVSPAQPGPADELKAVQVQLANYLMADPARSRSAGATIVVGNGRLALSSWEVTAFVDGIGDFSDVIQQGVAMRVLLFQAIEQVKDGASPQRLAVVARAAESQASRLQDAVTESRDVRNIEATVTLTATLQRLNELLETTPKLIQTP